MSLSPRAAARTWPVTAMPWTRPGTVRGEEGRTAGGDRQGAAGMRPQVTSRGIGDVLRATQKCQSKTSATPNVIQPAMNHPTGAGPHPQVGTEKQGMDPLRPQQYWDLGCSCIPQSPAAEPHLPVRTIVPSRATAVSSSSSRRVRSAKLTGHVAQDPFLEPVTLKVVAIPHRTCDLAACRAYVLAEYSHN